MRKELYYLKVLTPLHVGTGQGMDHIDLPIYREAHTGFPAIPSSAIKGTLRTEEIKKLYMKKKQTNKELKLSEIEEQLDGFDPEDTKTEEDDDIKRLAKIFGSKKVEGEVVFTDARILLFPVKSLKGIYALITCPYVLERFAEESGKEKPHIDDLSESSCIVFKDSRNTINIKDKKAVVLEEFAFEVKREVEDDSKNTIAHLLQDPNIDKKRVVIVSDDVFTHMVKSFTEVQTHIKVDIEKGTVEEGALWTEEYVPSEAIFYFWIINYRDEEFSIENGENKKVLQLGGNTSTGKGFVEVWNDGSQKS
ncbi:CRISPR-associated RAMP protein, Cmr4 family [Thermocrinis albus DSM 14484]|uniref:CRISPR-associated RAMP protein, Cmr4 family n=1 Tax=Thermocrinis albus (strain DSM 14484 / JCM 11386 / HI 11/12) TaxID=638303 RepID=D3SNB0_THEAH|nr:type III-B CRISPR module RAMP protein Cmr4 [Thermocrinis albus]ADC88647.1 CRISPR-associated RAMP protein, Cmr4 family [Thermocrinis albus DSM 14484]